MQENLVVWIVFILLIIICLGGIGIAGKGKIFGILIDNQGRMSLSRLQLTLWTILLVSAFGAAMLTSDPMTVNIYLAPEVWALLGISVGSAAGSVIVKSNKAAKTPDPNKFNATVYSKEKRIGVLVKTNDPKLLDLFMGEEIGDERYVDIGKVQMFFFTLALFAGYCAALLSCDLTVMPAELVLGENEKYDLYFPLLSDAMVTILGISHTGYLTIKATPRIPRA